MAEGLQPLLRAWSGRDVIEYGVIDGVTGDAITRVIVNAIVNAINGKNKRKLGANFVLPNNPTPYQ